MNATDEPLDANKRAILNRRLFKLARLGDADKLRWLLDSVDPVASIDGLNLLHAAAVHGRAECVALLLPLFDVAAEGSYGRTALHFAVGSGSAETVRALVVAGADLEAKASAHWSPLHEAAGSGYEACAVALLQAGADPVSRDSYGKTPLMVAAQHGALGIARHLLEPRNIDLVDREGNTALDWAVKCHKPDIVQEISDRVRARCEREALDQIAKPGRAASAHRPWSL